MESAETESTESVDLNEQVVNLKDMLASHMTALRNAIQRAPGSEKIRLNTLDILELRKLIRVHNFTGLMVPLSKSASYDDSFILVQEPITYEFATQVCWCYPHTMANNSRVCNPGENRTNHTETAGIRTA